MAKMIGFRPNARDEAMIEAERQRLVEYHNGAPITKCAAIRALFDELETAREMADA